MSASTKRKTRQAEIEAGTYKKQEAQRKRDEKQAKDRRTMAICIAVVAVIVVAAILLNVIPAIKEKQELRRYTEGVAVTVGDRNYSPAEIGYLYANQFSTFANNYYAAIYGLDTSNGARGLGSVAYTGPAVEGETIESWRDYFLYAVYTQLEQVQFLLHYANDQGITLDAEEQARIEDDLNSYKSYATMYGYPNVDQFLSANVGKGVTLEMISKLDTESALASKAYTAYHDSLSFSDEELKEEYASFNGDHDTFSFAYYRATAVAGEDGTVSDEARAEAEAEVDAILTSYQDAADVEDYYERFNGYIEEELGATASEYDDYSGSYISSAYADWVKDASRKAGDVTKIVDGDDAYALLFLDHKDANYPTVNVRHILIKAVADEDGTWSEEALAQAQAQAQKILEEFESGDKSEESFAALAEKYSEDDGSNTNGGLYENVYKGQMVTEFNDFCFAEGRKAGDTGIVYGTNGSYAGFHVMYYAGEGELYSDSLARESLTDKAVDEWLEGAAEAVPGAEEALVDPVTAPIATEAPAEG